MAEIPEEAVRAGAEALSRALFSGLPEYGTWLENDEHLARAAVEAAAPVLAEHIARAILADADQFVAARTDGDLWEAAHRGAYIARQAFTAGERPDGDAPARPSEAPQSDESDNRVPLLPENGRSRLRRGGKESE